MEQETPKYDVGQHVWVLGWEIATYKRVPVEGIVEQVSIEKSGGPTCPWRIFYLVQQWDSKDCCIDWVQFPGDDEYEASPSYFHRYFEQEVFPDKQAVLDEIARREYEVEHLFDE